MKTIEKLLLIGFVLAVLASCSYVVAFIFAMIDVLAR